MPPLVIRLLGSPEITFEGQPLSFRTRKALALLVYLAVEGGLHSREALMAFLWPESPASKASVAMRVTLSRLRQALQPVGEPLVTEDGKVGLDFSGPVELDLAWLNTAVLPDTPPEELAAILEIDRGEFLTGFSLPDAPGFDDWAALQRETCQREVEAVYDRLTQAQLANRETSTSVETAARWLARAPLSEAAYRRLMAAQALSGDRSAALKTYAQCQSMLQEEFGILPARETTVLAENIGLDRLPKTSGEGRPARQSPDEGKPAPGRRGLLLPFEGRADEHSQLVDAFRQTRHGGARVVALIGAAGVGKTRLVSAFREWLVLDSPGGEVWEGRAFEMGGHLPYQPVIEALRLRLEKVNAPEDLLEDIWLAELSQLMPELRARYPDLPPPMTGDASFVRARLFSAVAALGSALAARSPVAFFLDDMQWADADTRDLVHYLGRHWAENKTPILVVLVVRQESFAADTALREWLAQLGRNAPLARLLLDTLSGADVRGVVASLAGPDADEEQTRAFGDWLWAETHGLPFYIEALLQMLVAEGILAVSEEAGGSRVDFAGALTQVNAAGQIQVPPGVRQAILSRLDRLSEMEADILLASAVLGRECDLDRLGMVAGFTELQALEAVENLLDSRLLAENRAARRPYMPAHDYIREVVYTESHEARRRVFHRRALISLETDRAPAAECAYHALASMLDEPAFRFSLIAGDEALRTNALQESLAHYDRAREIVLRLPADDTALESHAIRQLYQNRGRVLELAIRYEAALANYQELADLAAGRDDQTGYLSAIIAQCVLHSTYNPVFDPQKGRELGETALDLALKVDDREAQARALWCLMMVEFHAGNQSQQVIEYGQKALVMARELGVKELEGYVLGNLSWAHSLRLQLKESLKTNTQALEIWQSLGNLPMVADALSVRLGTLMFLGDHEDLLAAGSELERLSQELENDLHHYMALLLMGEDHYLQGRLEQAFFLLEKAAAVGNASGDDRLSLGHRFYQIPVYLLAGAFEQAEREADECYTAIETVGPLFQNHLLAIIANAKIALGKRPEAQAVLEQALITLDRESSFSYDHWLLMVADGHLQLALGNPARALERMEDVIRKLRQAGGRYHLAESFWLQGKAYLAMEQQTQARKAFVQARAVAEAGSERAILWQILATFSEFERVCGNHQEAEMLGNQAQEIILYIADHAGDREDLRASFLARPEVAKVLARPQMRIPNQ